MRTIFVAFVLLLGITACVPAKKYNDLLEREKKCSEDLERYKALSLESGPQVKTLQARVDVLEADVARLKADTSELGQKYRNLQAQYKHEKSLRETLEEIINDIQDSDSKQLAQLRAELESKMLEVEEKADALKALETQLNQKQKLLEEREQRVQELEDRIRSQEEAVTALKDRLAEALTGFVGNGLTVEERDGKVYVSLEQELLFDTGSIIVKQNGKNAVIKLAKALENEEGFEVIIEGHTDTAPLNRNAHPRNNWELSVLRATAVVEIMTANSNMNPAIIMAAGRSEYHPVDPNNKAKNRRIEVIVAPNLGDILKLLSE